MILRSAWILTSEWMSDNFESIKSKIDTVEGWLNPPVVSLLYSICRSLKPSARIVEIGSWKGKSTALLALSAGLDSHIYAIDPHIGSHEHRELYGSVDTFEEFTANIKRLGVSGQVSVLRKYSQVAVDDVPNGFDFLWIDGSHEYPDVLNDFKLYFPKLKIGGHVAMHDYKWQGVKKFTWELLESDSAIGVVSRVEDTHYFTKLSKPSRLASSVNKARCRFYKLQQLLKRSKRKVRKKLNR